MSTQVWKRTFVVWLTSLMLFLSLNDYAAAEVDILPTGYKLVSLSTDWIQGEFLPQDCAVLAAQDYPGRPWQIMSVSEEFKFSNEILRIGALHKYHCTLLVKVN
jgi:hypothetical protein